MVSIYLQGLDQGPEVNESLLLFRSATKGLLQKPSLGLLDSPKKALSRGWITPLLPRVGAARPGSGRSLASQPLGLQGTPQGSRVAGDPSWLGVLGPDSSSSKKTSGPSSSTPGRL